MESDIKTPEQYIEKLPDPRKEAISELRKVISSNLPEGFTEIINYGMIGYVVSKSVYPEGYHVNPSLPLPFINIASQKNHISLYHFGLYADERLMDWFLEEYKKYSNKKPDMGKSCIRFKNTGEIPYELLGRLAKKITPEQWVKIYTDKMR
jgi:uncharacterized protein YdhG (YjbR/CyaY superfamily)